MIKFKRVVEDAIAPSKATDGSAGWDLCSTEDVIIAPGLSETVGTGIAMAIPMGYFGFLTHRSSLAFKQDSIASMGVIDSDFIGEIKVRLFNLGTEGVFIKKGDRFAQIVLIPCYAGDQIEEVSELPNTARGTGGFGSTNV